MREEIRWMVAASAALWACAVTAQTRELIFNNYLPSFDPATRVAVVDFAQRIEKESGGSLKITIPSSTLAPSTRQWDIVSQRVADLAIVANYSQRARLQLPLIADLPYNALSAEAASVALWKTQQTYFARFNEFKGVKLLGMYTLPPRQLVSGERPIQKMEDFKRLKVWTPAGELTDIVKGFGGVAVYSTFAELFEYASKRTVDAFMIGPGSIAQAKVGEYVKHMTEVPGGFGTVSFSVVMNGEVWSSLTAPQQQAVMRAADGLPQRVGRAIDERERNGLKTLHLQVTQASAELQAGMRPVLAREEAEWIDKARQRGIAQPEEVLKSYRIEMTKAYQAALTTSASLAPAPLSPITHVAAATVAP